MALTSVFYDGVATEADRAANIAGNPSYGVGGPDDFRVTAHPTIPYAVIVKAGTAHGRKLTDTAATDQNVQCPTLASGVRWDCIVVRRNWQPLLGGPSVLVPVSAGASPVIPTTLKSNPGVEDDQPIALVKWEGGKSAPTQFIDLRCWNAMGGAMIVDLLALGYLMEPGACVVFNRIPYQFLPVGNGMWDWVDMGGTSSSSANSLMRRDASNVTSVGGILLTAAQSTDARAATRRDYVDAQVAKLATQSANGAMSAADKKKLDAASPSSAASKIMMTGADGMIHVRTPTATTHPASKSYTDAEVARVATQSVAGAMSAADKKKLDAAGPSSAANKIMMTGADGYMNVRSDPTQTYHPASKYYADNLGTNQNEPGTIVRRTSAGQFYVGPPTVAAHVATKAYVDGLTPRKSASGSATMTFPAGSFFGAVNVNLPAGFASAPNVMVQLTSNIGWPALKLSQPMVVNQTATSFQIRCGTVDGQNTGVTYNYTFDWIAILH